MIDWLDSEIEKNGDRAAVVPVGRLADLRRDVEAMQARGDLNHFQKTILSGIYSLELPETGFEIRSIVIVASPSPARVPLLFAWEGRLVPLAIPASYTGKNRTPRRIEGSLNDLLNPRGLHAQYAPKLPHKLLAVRSGLGAYGRNNICYVEGMGSFLNLNPFTTDVPCEEDLWQEICQMDLCRTCQACLQHCPTGAILPDRFLIDNERCLTYFNEAGSEWDFPQWIDPTSHHTLYGCMRCQAACPMNRLTLANSAELVEFSEEETSILLERTPYEQLPAGLKLKIDRLDAAEYLGAMPRNLRAVLNQAGLN
jgi:epoxyqueuosine reductase